MAEGDWKGAGDVTDLRLGTWQETLNEGPSRLADASVRLILTSPPYDNARTYEGTNEPVDFAALARFCLRALVPGGTLAMVLDGPCENGKQSITPYRVICEWAALSGWFFHQFLAYGRSGVPGNTKGWFRRDHEPLLVFVKEGGEQVCAKDRIATRTMHVKSARTKRTAGGAVVRSHNGEDSGAHHRGSVWWYGAGGNGHDPSASTGHPATFAEAFARDAVDVWSNPGELVCDPFAGSATVGRACEDLGRRFVGAERVPKYHAIGMARLAQRGLFSR